MLLQSPERIRSAAVDAEGLFCVNYAHQSAGRFSAAGIEPYGCLRQVTAPADIGVKFACQGP